MPDVATLLLDCAFPPAGSVVDVAVSGGADSVGLALLVHAAELRATVHHVNHHTRPTSDRDEEAARAVAESLSFPFVSYDVTVPSGGNFEALARAERRAVLPRGVLTGHTMDDLAETMLINLLRGTGLDGLSPMLGDPTKPLVRLRRSDLRDMVIAAGAHFVDDESNTDEKYLRNQIRATTLPLLNDTARRDLVPLLARLAHVAGEDRAYLDELAAPLRKMPIDEVSCRDLQTWPPALLRRWLRFHLRSADAGDGEHPPSADEIDRALAVVHGDIVATQLSGGRRLQRRDQHLSLIWE